jgi:hypothetical protein
VEQPEPQWAVHDHIRAQLPAELKRHLRYCRICNADEPCEEGDRIITSNDHRWLNARYRGFAEREYGEV